MSIQVKRLMQRDVVKVRPESTVEDLDRILAEHGISGAPVVDEDGRVIGIVSQTDIVRLISRDRFGPGFYDGPQSYSRSAPLRSEVLRSTRVADIMERRIHYVWPDDDVSRAAAMMRRLGIHRLLVIEEGRLAGMLSTSDLIKVLENPAFFEEYYGLVRK